MSESDEARQLVVEQLQRRPGKWILAASLCEVFGINQAHLDREHALSSLPGFERCEMEVNICHDDRTLVLRDRVHFRYVQTD